MQTKPKIVYLAGPMKGHPDMNRQAFIDADERLTATGEYAVLNPARLPAGMPEENYMPICIAMLQQAEAIALLPGWMTSDGAVLEFQYAKYQNKQIIDLSRE